MRVPHKYADLIVCPETCSYWPVFTKLFEHLHENKCMYVSIDDNIHCLRSDFRFLAAAHYLLDPSVMIIILKTMYTEGERTLAKKKNIVI